MQFDPQRTITGLILAATVLFLMAGAPGMPGGTFRLWARRATVAVYAAICLGVLVYVGLWLLRVQF